MEKCVPPVCHLCAAKISAGEKTDYPLRCGFSNRHFPLFHYEKVSLCPGCTDRRRRVDRFEKALALVALAIVLYLMSGWFLLLFRTSGS